ncbi:T9SS-dependent M36 family metallopeptidase [Lacinutrix venerupis]|uniref:Peptidase n=1 Tax=Lacinutrix venerupis TaxID=1486034 RepID=A0AAC9PVV6_9FLAO|nr:T9SS-dependent M36 family metallopeptidase [Lacinutrix venerupis]APX99229.1 peptidase [Lacinutrix venerupis]
MKKNYIAGILTIVFLFTIQLVQAQNTLNNNQFGSLIQNWLNQNKEKYNLVESDLSSLIVNDSYFSEKTKINHIYINQAYQGVKIHNAISNVAIKDNYVFHYTNGLINNISSKVNTLVPVVNAESAINIVVDFYNLGTVSNLTLISNRDNNYVFNNGNISQTDIPVSLVFQKTNDNSIKLAWDLSIHALNGNNWYSVRVDAVTGEVLDTNDWIVKCNFEDENHKNHLHTTNNNHALNLFKSSATIMADGSSYNVFPIPVESPNHGSIQLITDPADDVASPFGWHDTDGASGAEFTTTRGNNVWAQEDISGNNNNLGASPNGTATLTFNFPFNSNQDPSGYIDTSITNLFYMNNYMHDVWYQYGFNEVSGNFQENNYGNGGFDGDSVNADAHDGSGINNATFGTPPDGSNPSMTMFLWSASGAATGFPLTVNNGTLAGGYNCGTASFGAPLPPAPLTADVALVVDNNFGQPASTDVNDACNTIINGAAINGKIAIVRRGVCEFASKVLAAENEGAVGVIVVNNVSDPLLTNMADGAVGNQVTIPSVLVSQAEGEAIIAALLNGETINASLVSVGPYQKDGSLDNGIVAHEYGHGISTRLSGGPSNSSCLTNPEQMGEGWSDWFALMLTMKATDLPETGRGIATYAVGQAVDGNGIRPAQYSTDFAVNNYTYNATNDNTFLGNDQNGNPVYWNRVVHNIGFVWGTVLWDLNWAYQNKYGFDADFYNGTGGNNKVMQLVIDGLKLQTCNPGMVDGRDALLAADMALTGGEDQCLIWEVFAARGLGFNASQGTSSNMEDQVEDFTMPPSTDPSLQNCTSLSVDEFNVSSQYSIYPNPANNVVNIKVKKNFGEVTMTLTDINGRVVLTKNTNLSSESQLNISSLQSGMYILTIKGEGINTNDKILKN